MARILLIGPEDPPDRFPDPADALPYPDGLLAAGGDLAPARLLAAYRRGIFPWYEEGQPILWWSPDPRAVLLPGDLHVSRSLRRTLRSNRYSVSVDQAFARVIRLCATTRQQSGTWITGAMESAYLQLHELGHAHSVETWQDGELVGGLYGIALGGAFFGESMFSTATDASKTALVRLDELLAARGIGLLDCQVASPHIQSMGSRLMPRSDFLTMLAELGARSHGSTDWREPPRRTAPACAARGPAPLRG